MYNPCRGLWKQFIEILDINRILWVYSLDNTWNTCIDSKAPDMLLCILQASTREALRWRQNGRDSVKSPASRLFIQPFIQTQIKENIKAPRHWPLCGEFTGTDEFPAQRASYAENVSIWWRHHEAFLLSFKQINHFSHSIHTLSTHF